MFYGTVFTNKSTPPLVSSGNWRVDYPRQTVTTDNQQVTLAAGQYKLTFLDYLAAPPSVVVSRYLESGVTAIDTAFSVTVATTPDTVTGQYYAYVYVFDSGTAADVSFMFCAAVGGRNLFDASTTGTVTLDPSITSFGGETILTLSTSSLGFTLKLDPHIELIGGYTPTLSKPDQMLTVSLSATTVRDDATDDTWTLTGYTYGDGSGTNGTAWGGSSTTLTVNPSIGGPQTTLESLVIVGTPNYANTNENYLSTDPRVVLTSVSPGGATFQL